MPYSSIHNMYNSLLSGSPNGRAGGVSHTLS
jgi:hypothetical protein